MDNPWYLLVMSVFLALGLYFVRRIRTIRFQMDMWRPIDDQKPLPSVPEEKGLPALTDQTKGVTTDDHDTSRMK